MKVLSLFKKIFAQQQNRPALLTLVLFFAASLILNAQAPNVTYKAPLTITKGGTYTGNYASSNSSTPAISINTSEPVIIENAIIKSAGHLIYSASRNCNIVIRNTKGYGLTPTVDNRPRGRFLQCYAFTKAIVENNYMENTAGIYIDTYKGSSGASETVRVRYNKAKNIDGRYRNSGRGMVQFCVLNNVKRVNNIEIAWNEIINKPNESAVEDNINMHLSSGTSGSPILIHDNYIQGAYPGNLSSGFSGGGIMLADGANSSAADASAFVRAYSNQIVSTTNYGIAIAGGHDNLAYNNRVVSCGYVNLSSGLTYLSGQNVGIYIMNVTKSTAFYNNTARDNVSGWVKKSLNTGRNDYYLVDGVNCTNNTSFSGTISMSSETSEYNLWLQKVASNKKTIGVTTGSSSGSTSTPTPAPVESGTTKRFEAETNYTVLADPGTNSVSKMGVSTHSAGASLRLFDQGDKARVSINVATAGNYVLKARVRSGYYTSSSSNTTAYWSGGYSFAVNGNGTTFNADNSTIGGKDNSYGGSYWGTMKSGTVSLKAGTNTVDVTALKSWLGVDYIEIVPSSLASSSSADESSTASATENTSTSTTTASKRYEAESIYSILADPGSNGIGKMGVSTLSAGGSVKLYDQGDKIRLSINVATAGNYVVNARVRSGYYTSTASNPTGYWVGGYTYTINGSGASFTGDNSTIGAKDASFGGSYWGTMKSGTVSLKAGTNTIDIAAVKSWLGVDYVEIVPSSSSQRLASEETSEEPETEVMASAGEFKAYPNPVTTVLNVEGIEPEQKSFLTIYRSTGEQVVSNEEIDSFGDKAIIDLQRYDLIQGVYLFKVQSGSKVFEKRIFKN